MFKKLFEHLPVTIMFCYLLYLSTNNIFSIIFPLFTGWLLDVDHFFDYFIFLKKTKNKINLKFFFSGKYFSENKKVYVLFHSWELAFSIFLISFFFSDELLQKVYFWTSISYLTHILIDQITNKPKFFGYFLIYRYIKSFNSSKFC